MTLSSIAKGKKILGHVPSSPIDQQWVYQSSRCFQLSSTKVGLMTNIRPGGAATVDLAVGNDLFVIDSFTDIEAAERFPINRSETWRNPDDGRELILSMVWSKGGFVPLGATRADGSPHPHVGTGFGSSPAVGYPAHFRTRTADVFDHLDTYTPDRGIENPLGKKARAVHPNPVFFNRLNQYRYDGSRFEVVKTEPFAVPGDHEYDDRLWGWGLRNGIPDGDDILFPLVGTRRSDGVRVSGVARWRFKDGAWNVATFTPAPDAENSMEPSIERDCHGTLFFTCRKDHGYPKSRSIVVWSSDDNGATWRVCIEEPNVRSASPVTINRTVDGHPFILGNALDPVKCNREHLAAWLLSVDRTDLLPMITVVDTTAEYGLLNGQYDWYADHPIGEVVRLADGEWRSIITYRFANRIEVGSDLPPTPLTGTYMAEVFSDGDPMPTWRLHD